MPFKSVSDANDPADHGLTSLPGKLQQITDVPIEAHSNNIGLYGVYTQFHVFPTDSLPGAEPSGSLQSISLSTSPSVLLEQRTKLVANVQATGGPANHVTIAYYDGDPAKNGTVLDVQSIAQINPGTAYYHRTFFRPETCGVHTLYADAWLGNSPEIQASATSNVTIHPADLVQALQRARMLQTILGCVIALVLLGGASGCGSNGSTTGIQPGIYQFTLQANSGEHGA